MGKKNPHGDHMSRFLCQLVFFFVRVTGELSLFQNKTTIPMMDTGS